MASLKGGEIQQIQRGVKLPPVERLAFDVRERRAVQLVDLLHQPLKARQAGGIGNTCAAEKHYSPLLVCLQERIRYVRAVGNELQFNSLLSFFCQRYFIAAIRLSTIG